MSTEAPLRIRVPQAAAGTRHDRFLAEPLGSRARAQSLIDAERVRVDGRVRQKRHALQPGEVIEVSQASAPAQAQAAAALQAPFTVAYQDEHLLVVDHLQR